MGTREGLGRMGSERPLKPKQEGEGGITGGSEGPPRKAGEEPQKDLTSEGFKLECAGLPLVPISASCPAQPKESLGMHKGVLSNKWGKIHLLAAAGKEWKGAWLLMESGPEEPCWRRGGNGLKGRARVVKRITENVRLLRNFGGEKLKLT